MVDEDVVAGVVQFVYGEVADCSVVVDGVEVFVLTFVGEFGVEGCVAGVDCDFNVRVCVTGVKQVMKCHGVSPFGVGGIGGVAFWLYYIHLDR